ncbi:hypothetical protein [Polynucleobacter acidiphobus]|uniref:hypothetical protein n=1 Tax=Polynucleobacter acidiphobus TaxID=556053 RepID=UPI000D38B1EB|nr:hypothetical protein [Polynucleobacter acidiphobus]
MKNQSLVNLFDLYDHAFNEVCNDLGIIDIPSWQERWLYRFLLINPVLTYYPYILFKEEFVTTEEGLEDQRRIKNLYEKGRVIKDPHYSSQLETSLAGRIADFLNPLTSENFSEWWFKYARNRIRDNSDVQHFLLNRYCGEWELSDSDQYRKWKKFNEEELHDIYKLMNNNHLTIVIPSYGNKKNLLRQINQILDKYHRESTYTVETKTQESTVKDCFRVLEYMIVNPQANQDLLELASKANVLKISRAGINNISEDSKNSVRAGVSRLIKMALEIMEASSYGFFPTKGNWQDDGLEPGVKLIMRDYFKLVSPSLIKDIKLSLGDYKKFKDQIRIDINKLKN